MILLSFVMAVFAFLLNNAIIMITFSFNLTFNDESLREMPENAFEATLWGGLSYKGIIPARRERASNRLFSGVAIMHSNA